MAKAWLRWLLTTCFRLLVLVGHFVRDRFADVVGCPADGRATQRLLDAAHPGDGACPTPHPLGIVVHVDGHWLASPTADTPAPFSP